MEPTKHLLIVDDDREIRTLLSTFFQQHGFVVAAVADGKGVTKRAIDQADLVLLDLMLPGESGLDICRRLRASSQLPIIMLTAAAADADRIVGLELGADDYVVKPFNPRELLARVNAVLRRTGPPPPAKRLYQFDGWRVDVPRRRLQAPDGVLISLSAAEFDLLVVFVEHAQQVLNRDRLLEAARGRSAAVFDRSIDVLVSRLRRKVEADPANPSMIKTVRTGGYVFTPAVSAVPAEAKP